jgi:Protein of unknown function (DUF3465)
MKKLLLAVAALVVAYQIAQYANVGDPATSSRSASPSAQRQPESPSSIPSVEPSGDSVETAFAQQRSNVQVEMHGVVSKLLKDDDDGSRHQRFIVRASSGQTVLVAHNIDLAPRIDALRTGDPVTVFGEYEWNDKGGMIHWTHHDPQGRHVAGWILHDGRSYQ